MDKQTEKDLVEGLKVEYDSTDQDYYSVLGLRPKELDKTTKNSLNKTKQNLLSAISKSGYKKKKELSDFVTTAYETLSNPETRKKYDEERSRQVTLRLIREEMISLNPNYYRLFTLKSPGQDLLPLRSEEKAQLDSVGGQHMEAVKQSHVKDEEKLLHFIKHAGDTLAIPESKKRYDEERVSKNLTEMDGGGSAFQDVDMNDAEGDSQNDDDHFVESNVEPDESLPRPSYEEATSILKDYLAQADDPNKKPEEPFDQYNNQIVNGIDEKYHQAIKVQYTTLKDYFRQISRLQGRINASSKVDAMALSNELGILHRTILKYSAYRRYPESWAPLLGTQMDAEFDASIPTQWDASYHAFPRHPSRKNTIMIAWSNYIGKDKKPGIFVMTPSGLDCIFNDSQLPSFKTNFPQYEYISIHNLHLYKKKPEEVKVNDQVVIFKDAWSEGGRNHRGLNPIYCVLQIGELIRVATKSSSHKLARGTKEMAVHRCEQRGITFLEPIETASTRNRAPKVSRDDVGTAFQKNTMNSYQADEISRLNAKIEGINSMIENLTSVMGGLKMFEGLKIPVSAH